MISDPQFWVAIAFIIFILSIINPVRKILNSSLDGKIKEIKESIEEAEHLKNDTQVILSEIKKRQNEVELENKVIHSNAKEKIKILESQAKIKLTEQSKKREVLTKTKIEQMVREANLLVQNQITQTAISAAIAVLEKKLNSEEKGNLINQSIKDLGIALKN